MRGTLNTARAEGFPGSPDEEEHVRMHTRTRQGQLVTVIFRDGRRCAWHFWRRRRTVLEFVEGTVRKDELRAFIPLSPTRLQQRS